MPRMLIALAILGLMTAPALAGSQVNIYAPSRNVVTVPESDPTTKAIQQNVAVTIVVRPYVSDRELARRALFQKWTGFINQYDGARYPF